jgi:hypothetical protein
LEAGAGGIAINANINVKGGAGGSGLDGGAIVADTPADLIVAPNVKLETKADSNGADGGAVHLTAGAELGLRTNAQIRAQGNTGGGGQGASVSLSGCSLTIASGAVVDATGYSGGTVELVGRGTVGVSSTASVQATGTAPERDGSVIVETRDVRGGTCSDDPGRECTVNADCNVGGGTGTCQGPPNPDVGQGTQLEPPAETVEDPSLVPCG